ncbi:MAG: flagellar motor switch protein FliN [Phycisphaerales bacterium]|nr:flagellar motor switch protein FliN [Phycisphaerales bacterium]
MADQNEVPNPASEPDDAALAAAQAAIAAARQANAAPAPAPATGPSVATFPSFENIPSMRMPEGMDLLSDVNLNVKIELGRTKMLLEDVLKLGEGTVVELDKLAGDPVDIYVNDRPVARGEVLVLNDNFCVRISEILNRDASDKPLHKR